MLDFSIEVLEIYNDICELSTMMHKILPEKVEILTTIVGILTHILGILT